MIVLDTNIVSPLMLESRDPRIAGWLNTIPQGAAYMAAVTVFEIRLGLFAMPEGRRKRQMTASFEALQETLFFNRVLPLDTDSATRAASVAALKRRQGQTIDFRDAMIAGIALAHGATVATRNIRHFQDTGVDLIDPLS